MGIIQQFDKEKGLFFIVWDGVVTSDDWFKSAQRFASDPAIFTTARGLADLRTVEDTSSIQREAIEQASDIFSADVTVLRGKRLAVVARDEFGKARYFGDRLGRFGASLVVFNNLDTACIYLEIDLMYASGKLEELRERLRSSPSSTLLK